MKAVNPPRHLATRRSGLPHLCPTPPIPAATSINGAVDAISIVPDGTGYVAHSNPDVSLSAPNSAEAVYRCPRPATAQLTRCSVPADTA
ncbi:MAG: hypothetical protein QOJ30_1286 [Pseudonocardiales bacterium]|jgi:hypothetical protein|nr:hypothetical protein [Pseudonocardiales bacterium]